jgi:hypothetical protein
MRGRSPICRMRLIHRHAASIRTGRVPHVLQVTFERDCPSGVAPAACDDMIGFVSGSGIRRAAEWSTGNAFSPHLWQVRISRYPLSDMTGDRAVSGGEIRSPSGGAGAPTTLTPPR